MFTPDESGSVGEAAAEAVVRRRWWSSCTLSLVLHAVALVALALAGVRGGPRTVHRVLVAAPTTADVPIDWEPVDLAEEPVAVTAEARIAALDVSIDAGADIGPAAPAVVADDASLVTLDCEPLDGPLAITLDELGLAVGGDGDGAGFDDEGAGAEVEFYGVKASGRRFVFVTDCSGSMDGYPLQRLKEQLHAVLGDLPPRIEFFIVFFSDGPIPMPAKTCLAATDAHKRRALAWVDTIQAGGGTDPSQALAIALALEPSVVFLLTDGMFLPEPAFQAIAQRNRGRRAQINTIAIGQQGAEPVLRRIAAENRGDYRFVPF